MPARLLPHLLDALQVTCYVALLAYGLRGGQYTVFGARTGDPHRLREAMPAAYIVTAAWLIFKSIEAIPPFTHHILDTTSYLGPMTPAFIHQFMILSAAVVCSAFICNSARSLWMLKSLDHAVFDPIPEWAALSQDGPKRAVEFSVRTVAAFLFLGLEFKLGEIGEMATGSTEGRTELLGEMAGLFENAGVLGCSLYFVLILWWGVGRWIASSRMPWWQLGFYVAGFVNAGFLVAFAQRIRGPGWAFILVALGLVAFLGALFMLFVVCRDLLILARGIRSAMFSSAKPKPVSRQA